MRRMTSVLLLVVLAAACRGDGPLPEKREGPAGEMSKLAAKGDAVTHKASYRYEVAPLKVSQETRVTIVSRPPDSLRHLDVVTRGRSGQEVSSPQWQFQKNGEFFTCFKIATVQCRVNTSPVSTFGHTDLDDFYELVRKRDSFESVKETERAEIAGESARCFIAQPPGKATPTPTAAPVETGAPPRATRFTGQISDHFQFELCYSDDGLLLRGVRTLLGGPVRTGSNERPTATLEAVSITRTVTAKDLELPAPVTGGAQSATPAAKGASPSPAGSAAPARSVAPTRTGSRSPS
ncbi:MAG TPA: hypothetical protein VNE62_09785 [Actinomycetota bacterium]|nr:hypothetical protein [Actinomycetota bacterium]